MDGLMDAENQRSGANAVKPLGMFGVIVAQPEFALLRSELKSSVNVIPKHDRFQIAEYLRRGTIIFPIMEHTADVLGGAFEVAGGSGVLSDGVFYWRRDAAEYIEYYGIALPEEFLRLGNATQWVLRTLTPENARAVYEYMQEQRRK